MNRGAGVSILEHKFYSDAQASKELGKGWRTKKIEGIVKILHTNGFVSVLWDGDSTVFKSKYADVSIVTPAYPKAGPQQGSPDKPGRRESVAP